MILDGPIKQNDGFITRAVITSGKCGREEDTAYIFKKSGHAGCGGRTIGAISDDKDGVQ